MPLSVACSASRTLISPDSPRRHPWILPVVIVSAVVLALCCAGGVIVAVSQEPDDGAPDAGAEPTPADTGAGREEEDSPEPPPEPEPEPEPAGFDAGVWEIDAEIPAGTYVTTAPGGGAFDSCYCARLSGFSGDFEEIIANGNINAGARGRLTITGRDAGVEFSGPCEWVEASEAAPVEIGAEVGEGVWAVGEEIQPGIYTTDVAEGGALDSCYWARLSGFSGDFDDLIANGNIEAGARGRIEIAESDTGVELSGPCTWSRS
jgi:hypothetical protein